MPWMECSPVSQREEFVTLIETQAVSFAELCRRFGVSRRTGYKWLGRFQADGWHGLTDRSRRPRRPPTACQPPAWGWHADATAVTHPTRTTLRKRR